MSLPSVFLTSVALARQWMEFGAQPDVLLGHSLGEYVAAHLAGDDKTALTYMDAAHYARSGYGMTSLGMSAISNAVRSRVDGLRDPGPILPTFPEFMKDIQPTVGSTVLVGDDLVSTTVGDGSTVVQSFDPFPAQRKDISCGFAIESTSTVLLAEGAPATALIPVQ